MKGFILSIVLFFCFFSCTNDKLHVVAVEVDCDHCGVLYSSDSQDLERDSMVRFWSKKIPSEVGDKIYLGVISRTGDDVTVVTGRVFFNGELLIEKIDTNQMDIFITTPVN